MTDPTRGAKSSLPSWAREERPSGSGSTGAQKSVKSSSALHSKTPAAAPAASGALPNPADPDSLQGPISSSKPTLVLPTDVTHAQAVACLRLLLTTTRAAHPDQSTLVIDCSLLVRFDSSVLAVLLECRRTAQLSGQRFGVVGMPARLAQLAHLYGVDQMLGSDTVTLMPASPSQIQESITESQLDSIAFDDDIIDEDDSQLLEQLTSGNTKSSNKRKLDLPVLAEKAPPAAIESQDVDLHLSMHSGSSVNVQEVFSDPPLFQEAAQSQNTAPLKDSPALLPIESALEKPPVKESPPTKVPSSSRVTSSSKSSASSKSPSTKTSGASRATAASKNLTKSSKSTPLLGSPTDINNQLTEFLPSALVVPPSFPDAPFADTSVFADTTFFPDQMDFVDTSPSSAKKKPPTR